MAWLAPFPKEGGKEKKEKEKTKEEEDVRKK
jgi:hypothetical protein